MAKTCTTEHRVAVKLPAGSKCRFHPEVASDMQIVPLSISENRRKGEVVGASISQWQSVMIFRWNWYGQLFNSKQSDDFHLFAGGPWICMGSTDQGANLNLVRTQERKVAVVADPCLIILAPPFQPMSPFSWSKAERL